MYTLAVLGTCWLRKPVIVGLLAILGYAALTTAITAFPMTESLEPIDVYNNLLVAERAGKADFARHGYPLVYGLLGASLGTLAVAASRLARPFQPTSH